MASGELCVATTGEKLKKTCNIRVNLQTLIKGGMTMWGQIGFVSSLATKMDEEGQDTQIQRAQDLSML